MLNESGMVNTTSKPQILIVDDEPLNVKLIAAMIPPDQYQTVLAYSGEEALHQIRDGSPDLIFLDIMMPGLNGFELTRLLKADPKSRDIPIVLVTAFGGDENEIKGLEAGADEFLNKPVNKTELLARLKSLLRLKQYQEQIKTRTCSINSFTASNADEDFSDSELNLPTILIAEDNELDAKIIRRYLQGEPYQIKLAKDGDEAIARAQHEKIDVILLDLLLPRKNGFEVCKTIKEMEHTQNIQIIATTGLSDLDSKLKGIELGVDDYLVKPVNMHVLRMRVCSLVKKKAYLDKLCERYERAVYSAITDKLTGLYSRGYFDHFLDLEIKRSARQNAFLALLLIDIDDFKQINDTFGHLFGDRILSQLGELLKANIREIDMAARYGGEEFAVVMANTDLAEAEKVAERIRQSIQKYSFYPMTLLLTVSIGIAMYPSDAISLDDLIERSDTSLYQAKRNGKNRVHSYCQSKKKSPAKLPISKEPIL
jgi:two-component system cell cycle response regulator